MRKSMFVPIIALLIAVSALTACTKTEKLEPALFKGQSEHWKVQVVYRPVEPDMEESASLEFMGLDTITEAAVTITYKNKEAMTYHVVEPLLLRQGQPIILAEKGKVKSWKDTEKMTYTYGPVGKVMFRYFPLNHIGSLD